MPNDEAKITMKGETYSLVQLHFHAPSEHTFNGKHALMEAHLVHKNDKSGGFGLVCGWLADMHVGVNWCTCVQWQARPHGGPPGAERRVGYFSMLKLEHVGVY